MLNNPEDNLQPEIEDQENILTQGVDSSVELAAAKKANEIFLEWDAESYLEFYGDIDFEKIPAVLSKISELASGENAANKTINLEALAAALQNENYDMEDLENFCLYFFMMMEVMPSVLGEHPEDNLSVLDVGSGPTVYQFILLSALAGKIQPAEYDESNRDALSAWIDGGGHDWSSYSAAFSTALQNLPIQADDHVMQRLERFRANPEAIDEYLRNILEKPVETDVFVPGLKLDQQYDLANVSRFGHQVVTSNFCVESAFNKDVDKWREGMANICEKVLPEGYLVMTAITGADWYRDGDVQVPATNVNTGMLTECLVNLGFQILNTFTMEGMTEEEAKDRGNIENYSGYSGMSCVLAKKGAN